MRVPPDPSPPQARPGTHRRTLWLLGALGVLLILLIAAQALSGFYTNFLWFHFAGVGNVWTVVTWTKVALGASFVAFAFALCFVSLMLVDAVAPRALFMSSDAELVRRYQAIVGPRAALLRTAVSLVVGLLLGVGASSQWEHWILFEHPVAFGVTDPLFHLDASFFVFQLPFLSFLVGWLLVALLIVTLLSAAGHFLNGAIRLHGEPHIEPRALAHLSLLLGAMALVRAWGYYFVDRYRLDLSSNGGFLQGASYTDVHVRLPAMTLLGVVSLVAFAMLVFNAYQRSLVLPAIAIGLWLFLAFALGTVYPALLQAVRVTPSQASLERPAIRNNIEATQFAMGLDAVTTQRFPANQDLTPGVLSQYSASLSDAQLWDPTRTTGTFDQFQDQAPYFKLAPISVDRYRIGGRLTPVDIGARSLNASRVDSGWINSHLAYTHGYGAVVAAANQAQGNGEPLFDLSGVPPTSKVGALKLTQPDVYYAPGEPGYYLVDTSQPEIDYENAANGATTESHYAGSGGVPMGSFLSRLAYAFQLKDFNLFISKSVTPATRLITVADIGSRVQKALPFLTVDDNPYPVIDHGRIEWVIDAYTTSASFPDAEQAPTAELPLSSPLSGRYNYVRDAVKVVVDAYSGKMRFYVVDGADPLMRSFEEAFPGMFRPLSAMDRTLAAHLRYPLDLLAVQAAAYGRYHVAANDTAAFYSGADAWQPSETTSSVTGSPHFSLPVSPVTGQVMSYQPIYELLQLPGDKRPSFEAVEPLVPMSDTGHLQSLSAIVFADSSARSYGRLKALVTPRGGIPGPGLVNDSILHDTRISNAIAQQDQGGATVQLGAVQIIPIADSLLYLRPLYVSSEQDNVPLLSDVIAVYGKKISIAPTLAGALGDVFNQTSAAPPSSSGKAQSSAPVPAEVRRLLNAAAADYAAAEKALSSGDLGRYQAEIASAEHQVERARALLGAPATTKANASPSTRASSAAAIPRAAPHGPAGTAASPNVAPGVVEEPAAPVAGTPTGTAAPGGTGAARSTGASGRGAPPASRGS